MAEPVGDGKEDLQEIVQSLREVLMELRSVLLESRNPLRKVMVDSGEAPGESAQEVSGAGEEEDLRPVSASPSIYPAYTAPPPPPSTSQPASSTTPPSSSNSQAIGVSPRNVGPEQLQPASPYSRAVGVQNEELGESGAGTSGFQPNGSNLMDNSGLNTAQKGLGLNMDHSMDIYSVGGSRTGSNAKSSFKEMLEIARTLWSLGEDLPPDMIDSIVDILEAAGAIDEKKKVVVKKFVSFMVEARSRGLTPEQQLVALYALARSLGIRDEEFEDEVFRSLVRIIGGRRWENRQ